MRWKASAMRRRGKFASPRAISTSPEGISTSPDPIYASPDEDHDTYTLVLDEQWPRTGAPLDEDHDTYTLVLDPKRKRKVVIQAPHSITKKELDRISAWLAVQLIVEDPSEVSKT
jgi:hypothetical protein